MKDVVVTERFRETMEYLSSVRAKARAMMDEADRRSMDAFFDGHAAVEVVLPRTNVRWITLDEARAMYPSDGQVVMACRPTLLCLAIREAATP